jgi:hypothetical protein
MSDSTHPFGEVIHSYTRKQAITDGVLVDLSQFEVVRQHWKHHVACTDTVWSLIETAVNEHAKDHIGILHDLSMCAKANMGHQSGDTIRFSCIVGRSTYHFKFHCGPGDTAEPVLTLMLPHED